MTDIDEALVSLDQRFWSKVSVRGADDCWDWIASDDGRGYGYFWYFDRMHRAFRLSWASHNKCALPPSDLQILHSCDNRRCVNPAHLRLGTRAQNMQDMVDRRRHRAHSQENCKHGHRLDRLHSGQRRCHTCNMDRQRQRRARIRSGDER